MIYYNVDLKIEEDMNKLVYQQFFHSNNKKKALHDLREFETLFVLQFI